MGSVVVPISCTWHSWGLDSCSTKAKVRHVVTESKTGVFSLFPMPHLPAVMDSCAGSWLRNSKGLLNKYRGQKVLKIISLGYWIVYSPISCLLISTHGLKWSLQTLGQTDFQFLYLLIQIIKRESDLFSWLVKYQLPSNQLILRRGTLSWDKHSHRSPSLQRWQQEAGEEQGSPKKRAWAGHKTQDVASSLV